MSFQFPFIMKRRSTKMFKRNISFCERTLDEIIVCIKRKEKVHIMSF